MIDFHSHILPGIDDGADCVETSLSMLGMLYSQGVTTVVATPHFHGDSESVDEFLTKREKAYLDLMKACEKNCAKIPEIVLGAEVALTLDTPKIEGIEKLCIGDTNTILIELPYRDNSEWITYAVYEIIARCRLVPVLAHFERLCTDKKVLKSFEKLLSLELFVQANADSFLDKYYYKAVKQLVKKGVVDVIGSDMHNLDERKSNMDKAVSKINRKFGKDYFEELQSNAQKLLKFS